MERGAVALARASLVLAGLGWVLPFLQPHHSYPLTAFYGEWLAFAFGLGAAFFLLRRDAWREATLPLTALAPLGLALLLGLQVALGRVPYPEQALTASLYLLWAMLLMILGRVLRNTLELTALADVLAKFMLAGGLLGALAAFLQLFGEPGPLDFLIADRTSRVYGNLFQPNHFAAHLALALASCGYLYGRGRLASTPCVLSSGVLVLGLALSASRSPWLYLGMFLLLAALVRRRTPDPSGPRIARFALWLLPAFALAHWLVLLPVFRPAHGVAAGFTSAERLFEIATGFDARAQLAGEAWHVFLGAPWIGAGWGQFAWHHFLFLGATGPGSAPGICNHAHNIVLQLLAETGVAGALMIVGAAGWWLWDLRKARPDAAWWWLLVLLAVIGVHSMLEYPLWYAYFLGIAALLLGAGSNGALALRFADAARLAAAACLAAGWVNLLAVLGPNREFERVVFDRKSGKPIELTESEIAASFARAQREPALTPYVELVIAHGIAVTPERLEDKLEFNTRVMHFAPVSLIAYREAMLLALAGSRAAALEQFARAAVAYPHDLEEMSAELRRLAARHPVEITPLLELAASKRAELRAPGIAR